MEYPMDGEQEDLAVDGTALAETGDALDAHDAHDTPDAAAPLQPARDAHTASESSDAAAAEIAAALAARLVAHDRLRRTVFEWMHAERLAALPYAARLPALDGARTAALADAWLADAGLPAPALRRFATPDAALVLLPPPALLRVFRLRALLDFADAVQGWIDRPRRALLSEWLGASGTKLLLTRRRELGGESSLAARFARAPSLDASAGDALAWRGLRLFSRECDWDADAPLAVLQFALPPSAAAAPIATPTPASRAHPATRAANGAAARTPSLAVLACLPALFEEATW
ncbi:hypothetical protein OKW46_000119 [Paraburkholderia sp. WSM4179]|nr:type III secretion protein HrpB4 [Paraburkholderia sp. WSM4179]MDH6146197.1 hypothetical protein [Paraburkholderia sp. WSM4179]